MATPVDRSLPSAGMSPCDFYSCKAEIPAGYFEHRAESTEGWAAGMFSKVYQGTTKMVTGYLSAGEFELYNEADNASAMSCLTLNWVNTSSSPGVPGGSTQAYIQLRDYSSGTPCSALFEFTDITVGGKDTTSLICAVGSTDTATHVVRFTVKNAPYWFLVRNVAPD